MYENACVYFACAIITKIFRQNNSYKVFNWNNKKKLYELSCYVLQATDEVTNYLN